MAIQDILALLLGGGGGGMAGLQGGLNGGLQSPMSQPNPEGADAAGDSAGVFPRQAPGVPLPPARPPELGGAPQPGSPIPQVGGIGPDGGKILAVLGGNRAAAQSPGLFAGIGGNVPGRGQSAWSAFASGVGSGIGNAREAAARAEQTFRQDQAERLRLMLGQEDKQYQRQRQDRQDAETKRWHDIMAPNYGSQKSSKAVDPVEAERRMNLAIGSDPEIREIDRRLAADDKTKGDYGPNQGLSADDRLQMMERRKAIVERYRKLRQSSSDDSTDDSGDSSASASSSDSSTYAASSTGGPARYPRGGVAPAQASAPQATPATKAAGGIVPDDAVRSQYPNARKAKDGNWYVPDPARQGKWLKIEMDGAQ